MFRPILHVPPSHVSFAAGAGGERLLLLGVRLLPRRPNHALARDIATERLWLRSIGRWQTLLLMAPWHRDPVLMAGLRSHDGPMPLTSWIRSLPRPNSVHRFCYAIVPKGQSRPVGIIEVNVAKGTGEAHSHLAVSDPAWRGQQVSVEARAAVLDLFFANGVSVFRGTIDCRNLASVFVYKRLGFRVVRTLEDEAPATSDPRRTNRLEFALTSNEWQRRRAVSASDPAARSGAHSAS